MPLTFLSECQATLERSELSMMELIARHSSSTEAKKLLGSGREVKHATSMSSCCALLGPEGGPKSRKGQSGEENLCKKYRVTALRYLLIFARRQTCQQCFLVPPQIIVPHHDS